MNIIDQKIKPTDSFELLELGSLSKNQKLLSDIYLEQEDAFVPIVKAGTSVSEALVTKLKMYDALYTLKKGLTCVNLLATIQHHKDDIEKSMQLLYTMNERFFDDFFKHAKNKVDLYCVEAMVNSITFLTKSNPNFLKSAVGYFINNDKVSNHTLHVTIYAIKFAHILGFNKEQFLQLGVASMLHDIGMKKLDDSLVGKSTPLSVAELEKVHKHSGYSVEYIKQNNIYDPYVIDAVAHHHERYDGSGYPNNYRASHISDFASILAICDVFDALTNIRPYRDSYTTFETLKMMLREPEFSGKFNDKYLKLLIKALT